MSSSVPYIINIYVVDLKLKYEIGRNDILIFRGDKFLTILDFTF